MKFARTAFLLLGLLAIAHAQGKKGGSGGKGTGGKTGGKGGSGGKTGGAGSKNMIAYGGHACNLHSTQIDCENDTANMCYYKASGGKSGGSSGGNMCCRALTAQCQACAKGMTEQQFCAKRPTYTGCNSGGSGTGGSGTGGSGTGGGKGGSGTGGGKGGSGTGGKKGGKGGRRLQRMCCMAMTAQCLACAAGQTEAVYCAANPGTMGCPAPTPVSPPSGVGCCRALTAQCLSCAAGMTEADYCLANPTTSGCGNQACCTANTADCMACSAGITTAEFCALPKNIAVVGCGMNMCCKAMTLPCLSCQANMLPSDYCKANPGTVGCKSTGAGSGAQGRCYGPGQGGLSMAPTPAPVTEPCSLASKKKDCKLAKGKFKKSGGCFFTKSTKECVDRDSLLTTPCTDARMQGKKECKLNSDCNYDKKAKTCSEPTCADEANARKCGKSSLGCKYLAAGCCVDSGYTGAGCP